jgi:predicted CXXCH cytochrome family protein
MKQRGLLTNHFRIIHTLALTVCLIFSSVSTTIYGQIKVANAELNPITETLEPELQIETTAPTITLTSPVNGDLLDDSSVVFTGLVSYFDTLEEVTIELFNENEKIGSTLPLTDGKWSITATLPNGTYTITAKAFDTLGNEAITDPVSISVETIIPPATITQPTNNSYSNKSIFQGTTNPNFNIEICTQCSVDENREVLGTWQSVDADAAGIWKFEVPDLQEGFQTTYIRAVDPVGNKSSISDVSFTYDKSRPVILPKVFPENDITHVPLDTVIKIQVFDDYPLEMTTIKEQLLTLSDNGKNVLIQPNPEYDPISKTITFIPFEPLQPAKKYRVYINPLLSDIAGNYSRPRFWSFTTIGNEAILKDNPFGENPHGGYQNNVNTCSNCHSTHVADNPKLLSDPASIEGKDISNYCNACHDGTVGAPIPENATTSHTHNYGVSIDGFATSNSCASCHNPHLDWSEKNPNLLQDHFTYDHPDQEQSIPASSKEQLCESCHESDSLAMKTDPRVDYRIFQYNKWNTSSGVYEDYQLCLRCHNPLFKEKHESIPDIASFYNNLDEKSKSHYEQTTGIAFSDREITPEDKAFSGHIIKAQDGSPLAGHIPCADCHDTHGSDNIKQLKKSIGHENPTEFSAPSGEWSEVIERQFCLTCHNGSTVLYGITVNPPDPALSTAHTDNTKACSSCHGGSSASFIEAAHAPKRFKPE